MNKSVKARKLLRKKFIKRIMNEHERGIFQCRLQIYWRKTAACTGDDVALVEINPEMPETKKRTTWKEFDLIEPSRAAYYRREITWNVFNEKGKTDLPIF